MSEEKTEWKMITHDLTPEEIADREAQLTQIQSEDPGFIDRISAAYEQMPEVITISHAELKSVDYPLDKINSEVWHDLESADPSGQITLRLPTSRADGEKQGTTVTYSINFQALDKMLEENKAPSLTDFDKRVYIASEAIFKMLKAENAKHTVITLTQIYYAMGYTGRPNTRQLQDINNSLEKMRRAKVYIDTAAESKAGMYDGKHYFIDSYLLQFTKITQATTPGVTAYLRGQEVNAAFHILEEPALFRFARYRNQITTFSSKLLQTGLSKTITTLRLEDYLIERISHIKRDYNKAPKREKKEVNRRILYDTLFKACRISGRMQKLRARETVRKILDHYKTVPGFISDYITENDGITIVFEE